MSPKSPVAVIPAAGIGSRLADSVPGSKEVADVGGEPVIAHVLRRLARASLTEVVVVLRVGKEDIPAALAGYDDVDLTYIVVDDSPSELHSVAAGVRSAEGRVIALAYADILFQPHDAFSSLLERLEAPHADVVLGLFPTARPERVDMVALDARGRPTEVVIKQPDRGLRYSWSIAGWTLRFSGFLSDFLNGVDPRASEPSVGDVVQAAIDEPLAIDAVVFGEGYYLDVGTPDDLQEARKLASS